MPKAGYIGMTASELAGKTCPYAIITTPEGVKGEGAETATAVEYAEGVEDAEGMEQSDRKHCPKPCADYPGRFSVLFK